MGILGPMLIFTGLGDVYIAGGVPASEMPNMHWVDQSDSMRLDNTYGDERSVDFTSMTGSSVCSM